MGYSQYFSKLNEEKASVQNTGRYKYFFTQKDLSRLDNTETFKNWKIRFADEGFRFSPDLSAMGLPQLFKDFGRSVGVQYIAGAPKTKEIYKKYLQEKIFNSCFGSETASQAHHTFLEKMINDIVDESYNINPDVRSGFSEVERKNKRNEADQSFANYCTQYGIKNVDSNPALDEKSKTIFKNILTTLSIINKCFNQELLGGFLVVFFQGDLTKEPELFLNPNVQPERRVEFKASIDVDASGKASLIVDFSSECFKLIKSDCFLAKPIQLVYKLESEGAKFESLSTDSKLLNDVFQGNIKSIRDSFDQEVVDKDGKPNQQEEKNLRKKIIAKHFIKLAEEKFPTNQQKKNGFINNHLREMFQVNKDRGQQIPLKTENNTMVSQLASPVSQAETQSTSKDFSVQYEITDIIIEEKQELFNENKYLIDVNKTKDKFSTNLYVQEDVSEDIQPDSNLPSKKWIQRAMRQVECVQKALGSSGNPATVIINKANAPLGRAIVLYCKAKKYPLENVAEKESEYGVTDAMCADFEKFLQEDGDLEYLNNTLIPIKADAFLSALKVFGKDVNQSVENFIKLTSSQPEKNREAYEHLKVLKNANSHAELAETMHALGIIEKNNEDDPLVKKQFVKMRRANNSNLGDFFSKIEKDLDVKIETMSDKADLNYNMRLINEAAANMWVRLTDSGHAQDPEDIYQAFMQLKIFEQKVQESPVAYEARVRGLAAKYWQQQHALSRFFNASLKPDKQSKDPECLLMQEVNLYQSDAPAELNVAQEIEELNGSPGNVVAGMIRDQIRHLPSMCGKVINYDATYSDYRLALLAEAEKNPRSALFKTMPGIRGPADIFNPLTIPNIIVAYTTTAVEWGCKSIGSLLTAPMRAMRRLWSGQNSDGSLAARNKPLAVLVAIPAIVLWPVAQVFNIAGKICSGVRKIVDGITNLFTKLFAKALGDKTKYPSAGKCLQGVGKGLTDLIPVPGVSSLVHAMTVHDDLAVSEYEPPKNNDNKAQQVTTSQVGKNLQDHRPPSIAASTESNSPTSDSSDEETQSPQSSKSVPLTPIASTTGQFAARSKTPEQHSIGPNIPQSTDNKGKKYE